MSDAFEYFGQASIYDPEHDSQRTTINRTTGKLTRFRVHMADGPGVFGRWHAFIRSSILFGIEEEMWMKLDRLVAIAYVIHFEVKPLQSFEFPGGDGPENIPADQTYSWREKNSELLESWRDRISKANIEELDKILGRSFSYLPPFD